MDLYRSIGKPVLRAGSLWCKKSWEGTNDMAPFPCSHDVTRPHDHTTLKHTLQFYTLSNRCLRESRAGVQAPLKALISRFGMILRRIFRLDPWKWVTG